jgi:DNA mismatch endonuclease (patch repair protein)
MDVFSRRERSRIMSRIRSLGNATTELRLIELFRVHKITGWRRRVKLRGTPDFVFTTQKVAVFVDGCVWHGCPKHCRMPKGNRSHWQPKIAGNIARDAHVASCRLARGARVGARAGSEASGAAAEQNPQGACPT